MLESSTRPATTGGQTMTSSHDPLRDAGEVKLGAVAGALNAGRVSAKPCIEGNMMRQFPCDSD